MLVLKKWHVASAIAVILLIVIIIATVINVNAFQNEWVERVYSGEVSDYRWVYDDYYAVTEDTSGDRITEQYTLKTELNQKLNHAENLNGAIVSNVYMFRYFCGIDKTRMQVRFRVAYYLPFMHEDMFWESTMKVTDADGKELNCIIGAAPDTTAGFHGMKVALKFEEADFPKAGEKIYFSFTSAEEGSDAAYASGRIEIEMV